MLAFPPLILNRISVSFSFLDISEAGDGGYMVNPIVRFDPRLRKGFIMDQNVVVHHPRPILMQQSTLIKDLRRHSVLRTQRTSRFLLMHAASPIPPLFLPSLPLPLLWWV